MRLAVAKSNQNVCLSDLRDGFVTEGLSVKIQVQKAL